MRRSPPIERIEVGSHRHHIEVGPPEQVVVAVLHPGERMGEFVRGRGHGALTLGETDLDRRIGPPERAHRDG